MPGLVAQEPGLAKPRVAEDDRAGKARTGRVVPRHRWCRRFRRHRVVLRVAIRAGAVWRVYEHVQIATRRAQPFARLRLLPRKGCTVFYDLHPLVDGIKAGLSCLAVTQMGGIILRQGAQFTSEVCKIGQQLSRELRTERLRHSLWAGLVLDHLSRCAHPDDT